MSKCWYVYILASKKNGAIYVWVTSDLIRRIWEHRGWVNVWFTQKYFVKKLVYYEESPDMYSAISREKQLKWWNRQKKIVLINSINPERKDLYEDIGQ
jgi:putative endonuclease